MFGNYATSVNLQSTLSSNSAGGKNQPIVTPHHPITCTANLYYEEDGTFRCDHASVPPDDPRMGAVLNHSIAILLLEVAFDKFFRVQ